MKKIILLYLFFLFYPHFNFANIQAIFIDVEVIFHTNSIKAAGYVGSFDSLKYLAQVGHLPCQEDLFKQLKPVPALSTKITYNKNLSMPLIFSDWLAALQPAYQIKETIQNYFDTAEISKIEKKVLLAVVSMMLTAHHLADTQQTSSYIEHCIEKLIDNNYKVYLVGNWAHIESLKYEFPDLFNLFSGIYTSGDLHLLKPYAQFYSKVLELSGITSDNALWIETEPIFADHAHTYGHHVIVYEQGHKESFKQQLQKFNILL